MNSVRRRAGWRVDPDRCREHGLALRGVRPSAPPSHSLAGDPVRAVLAEALVAAVCHATNWERLRGHVLAVATRRQFTAHRLANLGFPEFERDYQRAFDDAFALEGRYKLFTDTAAAFADGRLDVDAILASPVRLEGVSGLLERL